MKKTAIIEFYKCIQDSQELGSNNEHVISRIFFRINIAGEIKEFSCNINQAYGSEFSYENDPLEVTNPFIGQIPFNYGEFRNQAEMYYRMCVGASANGINIKSSSNIRMMNNTFNISHTVKIDIQDNSPAW